MITFGGRSFSILEVREGGTLAMVYDSGQELEARHHTHWPQLHNMDFPDGFCAPNPTIARQLAGARARPLAPGERLWSQLKDDARTVCVHVVRGAARGWRLVAAAPVLRH